MSQAPDALCCTKEGASHTGLELQLLFCCLKRSHMVHMGGLARHNISSESFSGLFLAVGNIEQIH